MKKIAGFVLCISIIITAISGLNLSSVSADTQGVFAGHAYYVDSINGNDNTGDGSYLKPWKSFKYIIQIY